MSEYLKPLPKPSPTSRPFWEAARRHRTEPAAMRRVRARTSIIRASDARTASRISLSWERVSGRGKVYSYTVVRRASTRSFADEPYVLAIVELDEGPRMTTNIVARAGAA